MNVLQYIPKRNQHKLDDIQTKSDGNFTEQNRENVLILNQVKRKIKSYANIRLNFMDVVFWLSKDI